MNFQLQENKVQHNKTQYEQYTNLKKKLLELWGTSETELSFLVLNFILNEKQLKIYSMYFII